MLFLDRVSKASLSVKNKRWLFVRSILSWKYEIAENIDRVSFRVLIMQEFLHISQISIKSWLILRSLLIFKIIGYFCRWLSIFFLSLTDSLLVHSLYKVMLRNPTLEIWSANHPTVSQKFTILYLFSFVIQLAILPLCSWQFYELKLLFWYVKGCLMKQVSSLIWILGKKYCYGSTQGEYCHCDYCKCKHGYGSSGYGHCH